MEVLAIEHENTILELKDKNQKLKRKLVAADETAADRADECKNLAIRLAVGHSSCAFRYDRKGVTLYYCSGGRVGVGGCARPEQVGAAGAEEEVRACYCSLLH